MQNSVIDAAIVQAYLETEYRVYGNQPFTLRIGEFNPVLTKLHGKHDVEASAFITAWNPHSRSTDTSENDERQTELARDISQLGLDVVEGIGQHPTNGWHGEVSLLILGLSRESAMSIGLRYQQNAIVWTGKDSVPELLLLW